MAGSGKPFSLPARCDSSPPGGWHLSTRSPVSEECGDKLLDARRKAYPGCTMCVECQSNMELRKKIGGM
ncbi:TraR/DksA C4-type zinc finger protein [Citrobacter portucalensis]|uniref:TraR/DksA C4-type zinc finger protein n=1 Tax=Citrobacter portucalensis TaxID=1639133 RepID=UPI00339D87C4